MAKEKKQNKAPSRSAGIGINEERLRNMKVQDKFSHIFNRLLVFMLVASAALIFTVLYCIVQYNTMYKKYYATTEHAADGRAGNIEAVGPKSLDPEAAQAVEQEIERDTVPVKAALSRLVKPEQKQQHAPIPEAFV